MVAALLETEEGDPNFFPSGPGFGGTWPRFAQGPTPARPQQQRPATRPAIANMGTSTPARNIGSQPLNSAHKKPSVDDDFKTTCHFVKSHGEAIFEHLPDTEQMKVNFSKNIFKVFATKPGERLVRLVDPNLDISTLKFIGNDLRDPVEKDCQSWMRHASPETKLGRQFYRPIVFIPPRGFLLVAPEESNPEAKLEELQRVLTSLMDLKSMTPLTKEKIYPGMPAVYVYSDGNEHRFYRVLIIGTPHHDGDLLTLLMDVCGQHYADAKFQDLYEMPVTASFNVYPPKVIYANLFGIRAIPEKEQEIVWRNVDDDERKRDICVFLVKEASKIPLVDMVWRDEFGKLEWLSKILHRRGAMLDFELRGGHLNRTAESAFPPSTVIENCVMDYIVPQTGGRSELQTEGLASVPQQRTANSYQIEVPFISSCSPPFQPSATPSPIITAPTRMIAPTIQRIESGSPVFLRQRFSPDQTSSTRSRQSQSPIPLHPRNIQIQRLGSPAHRDAPRHRDISPIPRATTPFRESSLQRSMSPVQFPSSNQNLELNLPMNALNIYTIFDEAIKNKEISTIFGVVQFARTVLPSVCHQDAVNDLLSYMSRQAMQHLRMNI